MHLFHMLNAVKLNPFNYHFHPCPTPPQHLHSCHHTGFLSFDRSRKPQTSTSPKRASSSSAAAADVRRPASAVNMVTRPLSAVTRVSNTREFPNGVRTGPGVGGRVQSAKIREDAVQVRGSSGAQTIDFRGDLLLLIRVKSSTLKHWAEPVQEFHKSW